MFPVSCCLFSSCYSHGFILLPWAPPSILAWTRPPFLPWAAPHSSLLFLPLSSLQPTFQSMIQAAIQAIVVKAVSELMGDRFGTVLADYACCAAAAWLRNVSLGDKRAYEGSKWWSCYWWHNDDDNVMGRGEEEEGELQPWKGGAFARHTVGGRRFGWSTKYSYSPLTSRPLPFQALGNFMSDLGGLFESLLCWGAHEVKTVQPVIFQVSGQLCGQPQTFLSALGIIKRLGDLIESLGKVRSTLFR